MQSSQPATVFFLTNFVVFSTKSLGNFFLVLIQTNFCQWFRKNWEKKLWHGMSGFFSFLFFQFCDVATFAIIHRRIQPSLATSQIGKQIIFRILLQSADRSAAVNYCLNLSTSLQGACAFGENFAIFFSLPFALVVRGS